MRVDRLDHLVLTVSDVDATCDFYARTLGLRVVGFGRHGRRALWFGGQKINLHQQGGEFEPKSEHPTPGSADLCFVARDGIPDVISHLENCGVEIIEGPILREGALGEMVSVYFRDPDGNLIEVSSYRKRA
ncbi:VOC family protein [Rubrobacter indicoceani]|uniref:VOC family protein n=1 Tax=Rubrobacter indicoceani TaxID=2051957 RepID=UPI000E5B4531|nr:VOC family protein [Rubrobacter indicoceani]